MQYKTQVLIVHCFVLLGCCSIPILVDDEKSGRSDSPGSSMDLEQGTLNDMYRYGITPPANPRQRKLVKERDRSQKIKVAKRENSVTKNMRRVTISTASDDYTDNTDVVEGEVPTGDSSWKRKDSAKNFKTTTTQFQ